MMKLYNSIHLSTVPWSSNMHPECFVVLQEKIYIHVLELLFYRMPPFKLYQFSNPGMDNFTYPKIAGDSCIVKILCVLGWKYSSSGNSPSTCKHLASWMLDLIGGERYGKCFSSRYYIDRCCAVQSGPDVLSERMLRNHMQDTDASREREALRRVWAGRVPRAVHTYTHMLACTLRVRSALQ